jgi:hypothetical protein
LSPTFGGHVIIDSADTGSLDNMIIGNGTPQAGKFTQLSATGNITGQYILGDGGYLSNIATGSFGNANVAAYLPTYTGNLSGNNLTLNGNAAITGTANIVGNVNVGNNSRINGVVNGQLYGLTNGVNTFYGTWDFGYIAANTYTNPIQWIFAQTSAGNLDLGTILSPASYEIDIGTIF